MLTSILKTTAVIEGLIFEILRVSDGKVNRFDIDSDSVKYTKKLRKFEAPKLSKSEKLKNKKLAKFKKPPKRKIFLILAI